MSFQCTVYEEGVNLLFPDPFRYQYLQISGSQALFLSLISASAPLISAFVHLISASAPLISASAQLISVTDPQWFEDLQYMYILLNK